MKWYNYVGLSMLGIMALFDVCILIRGFLDEPSMILVLFGVMSFVGVSVWLTGKK
jgi:hypothetical protein